MDINMSGAGVRQSQARLEKPGSATRPWKHQLDSSRVSHDSMVRSTEYTVQLFTIRIIILV